MTIEEAKVEVMTEKQMRQKVVAQARAWLGLCEPTTYLPILEIYNDYARQHGLYVMRQDDPWCANTDCQ